MNYFQILHITESFNIDHALLEQQYLALQQQFHPDKYTGKSQSERTRAAELASTINSAYETLKHPVKRAKYILLLQGYDADKEQTIHDKTLLMEIMELRQELAEIEDKQALQQFKQQLEAKAQRYFASFAKAYAEQDKPAMQQAVNYMIYFDKTLYEVKLKERV